MSKIEEAIKTLQEYEPPEGYLLGFSGGKDSIVIHDLAKRSGVKFQAIHNYTTVDYPDVIAFIKESYPDVKIVYPDKTMFQIIASRGIPMRTHRKCCEKLKENYGWGRTWIIGVRWAESNNRKKNSTKFMYFLKKRDKELSQDDCENRYLAGKAKKIINIIIDWTDDEVWNYIRSNNLKYPAIYNNGQTRVGCIGCPMGSKDQMEQQFADYPNVKKAYLWAIQKYLEKSISEKRNNIFTRLGNAREIFDWWVSKKSEKAYLAMKEQTDWTR